jgi:uncharacterized spore protein YtfJ
VPGAEREAAEREAQRAAATPALLERLAERVGAAARSEAVFGAPVERGAVTVVPVAKASWGFGGGAGGEGAEQGSGGGGGGSVKPLGYIELRDDSARFVPLRRASPRAAAAGVALACLVGAVVGRLLRD